MKYDIAVIIPFLNERENIQKLVRELNDFVGREKKGLKIQVIFVDDGSTDDSTDILKRQKFNFDARIVQLSRNYGSHAAIRAGVFVAESQFVTFTSVDLQDPLNLITELYTKCLEGNDIVWACRESQEMPFIEKLFSNLYAKLMRRFVAENFPENGFGIIMFNQKIGSELNRNIESNSSIFLQILTMGFRQNQIFYHKAARVGGKSKWTFSKKLKLLVDSFVAFSYVPIRLVGVVGITLSFLGLVGVVYVIMRTLLYHDLSQGWPALMAILMIGFGATNISLGIIAEYLWRTFDTARHKSVFIINEIIDLKGGK